MTTDLLVFYPDGHTQHHSPGHPERPERLETIRTGFIDTGWWDKFCFVEPIEIPDEVMLGVHSKEYLSILQKACQNEQWLDADTYTKKSSWDLCLRTAGGTLALADTLWESTGRSGFALTRPPGHHATREWGMGFCLINNIALAADYLIRIKGAEKIAIIDLDLHHGNGTQDIFWERDDVLFISIHQSPLYPQTGKLSEQGGGKGVFTTVNLPFPPGTGDYAYLTAMNDIVLPLLNRYHPDMLLISFGFDIHWLDPLGSIEVSATACKEIILKLLKWADEFSQGRMMVVLEGGYDLDAAVACSCAVVSALTGYSWTDPLGCSNKIEIPNKWEGVIHKAKEIWSLS